MGNKSLSVSPSPPLRKSIEQHKDSGTPPTGRINQIWDRYSQIINKEQIPLSDDEKAILLNLMQGSFIDNYFIEGLELEITDSDEYQSGSESAVTLLEKITDTTFSQRVATIELLGR